MNINQVQEHANERSVALSIKATKITARLVAKAMQAFLRNVQNPKEKRGKQSLKSLTSKGASIENVEISSDNIALFKKTARKYNIDFALKKDGSTDPPNCPGRGVPPLLGPVTWIVFFKSKDSKSLEMAFKEFSKQVLKHRNSKPPITQTLERAKEKNKAIIPPTPAKSRGKGDVEL